MRKILMLLGVVVALAIPTAALAASLDTGKFGDFISQGSACEHGAFYHIVHPGPDGGADGNVTVDFSGTGDGTFPSYQSPGNTTHYLVFGTGTLVSASDDISSGKLVISGVACKKGKGK
jgi:hypothetical protein